MSRPIHLTDAEFEAKGLNYEWAMKHDVPGIPTLLIVSGGKIIDRQVGALPAPVLKAKAENLLTAACSLPVVAN